MEPELYEKFYQIEESFWWSVGTRRIFRQLIDEAIGPRAARVLDVGCGTGAMLAELSRSGRMAYGCDRWPRALAFCRQRGQANLVCGDATQLPFQSDCMDVVTALDVIEHLDDDETCIKEITRLCRPGGYALIHVPAFPVLWSYKDELNHHRRRYRRAELRGLVERCGLRVMRLFYVNAVAFPLALLLSFAGGRQPPVAESSAKMVERLYRISPPVNWLMSRMMDVERWVGAFVSIPFGMSLVCLARRPAAVEAGSPPR